MALNLHAHGHAYDHADGVMAGISGPPPGHGSYAHAAAMCDTWCYRYSCNMIHLLLNLVSAADSTDAEGRRGATGGASANPLQRVSCRVDELCETRGQCCCQIWTAVDLTAIRAGDNVRIYVSLRGGGGSAS